ncbi:MAG TPA: Hsp20/alpha crystallin family protein [Bryobacteraceae bacterium]|jgi:HSP20 family protein
MADVNVKKSSNQTSSENAQGGTSVSRPPSSPGTRFGSGWSPEEFFYSNPFTLMRRMSEEMDRTFGQFFGQSVGRGRQWHPELEITEKNGKFCIQTDLPGLRPDDVKVEITGDRLTISGERKSENENREGGIYRSERRYGQFYREIALPEGVNADEAKANFHEGVLEITLPVPLQTSNRRQIPIQTGEAASQAKAPGSESSRQSTAAKASGAA